MEPETQSTQTSTEAAPVALPPVQELVQSSWAFTKDRLDLIGWYVVLSLFPLVLLAPTIGFGVWAASSAPQLLWVAAAVGVAASLLMIWVMVVASAGLLYAVAQPERTRFVEGWRWARPRFWSIAWIGLLLMLVLVPSFLAFVIPALVIIGYTLFYFLTFMRHDHRGLHALAASTHLVYGRFWKIAGRMLVMFLIIMGVSLGITLVFEVLGNVATNAAGALYAVGEVLNMVASFVLTIMMMRYLATLYYAADATAMPYQPEPKSTSYTVYRLLSWLGLVLLVVLPVGLSMLAMQNFMNNALPAGASFEQELEPETIDVEQLEALMVQ